MTQFERLVDIMAHLRAPEGCPWDREQTHETLKPYLIEEAYEVLDAIDDGDNGALAEELGDVLLQVVFHAQVANESGHFDAETVARSICDKLVRRHPHVFGDSEAEDADQVLSNWEKIKSDERRQKTNAHPSVLDGVPRHLPALLRAERIQKKVARVGFDWDNLDEVAKKTREEVEELIEVLDSDDRERMIDELGDVLFSIVNLARFVGLPPEEALTQTNRKFINRFRYIEQQLEARGQSPESSTLEEMDALWEESKNSNTNSAPAIPRPGTRRGEEDQG